MKVVSEHVICDVCENKVWTKEHTKIEFSKDGEDYVFDTCFECLRGSSIRRMYNLILRCLRGEFKWKSKKLRKEWKRQ